MNSRQYAKKMKEACDETLTNAGILEYNTVCLSADRTEYEVTFKDGSVRIIESGFEYFED